MSELENDIKGTAPGKKEISKTVISTGGHDNLIFSDYCQYIEKLSEGIGKDEVFYNKGQEHAAFVMSKIFEKSSNEVKIFAGCFSGEISNSQIYQEALVDFISRGQKVKILLQKKEFDQYFKDNGIPQTIDILKYYHILYPNKIEVKIHPYKYKTHEKEEVHFTIGDDKMYRLEVDTKSFQARGNFNDPIKTKEFDALFEDIWADPVAETYPL